MKSDRIMELKKEKYYDLISYCEVDKFASKSYSAIHGISENKNLGDITIVNENEIADFNMMCFGSPCQDFSLSGKQQGAMWECKNCGESYNPLTVHYSKRKCCPICGSDNLNKTRSSLLVEALRVLKAKLPDWGIYENVKNITSKKFKETFEMFLGELDEYGYNTYWKILNAKNYGIPQNRERVYVIFIKKELDNGKFKFPDPFDNGIRLKDMLDDKVDNKFYINNECSSKCIEEIISSGKSNKEYSNSIRVGGEEV